MDDKTIKHLTTPFEGSQLRTRKGKANMSFTYVDGALVIERLNQAFGHNWSWAVLEWAMDATDNGGTDVRVQGRLSVRDGEELVCKDAFGGVLVPARGMDCTADMLKAASTDALKKAASLLGVALHLYSDEVDTGDEPRPSPAKPPAPRQLAAVKPASAPTSAPKTTGNPASDKQKAMIMAKAKSLGWDNEKLHSWMVSSFKSDSIKGLDSRTASQIIDALMALESDKQSEVF